MPSRGRGQYLRLANTLRIHPTLVSQIFRGGKELTPEQACGVEEFFGLSPLETEYYVALVERARAGTPRLRRLLDERLGAIRKRSANVAAHLPKAHELTPADRARFYSSWNYSAIRLLTSIPDYRRLDAVAEYLGLSRARTRKILEFLVSVGLCEEKDGEYRLGAARTHLAADDELVPRHHGNWREKAIQRSERIGPDELMFTAPLTLAKKDVAKVRQLLLKLVSETSAIVETSEAERIYCLNLDWFEVR